MLRQNLNADRSNTMNVKQTRLKGETEWYSLYIKIVFLR